MSGITIANIMISWYNCSARISYLFFGNSLQISARTEKVSQDHTIKRKKKERGGGLIIVILIDYLHSIRWITTQSSSPGTQEKQRNRHKSKQKESTWQQNAVYVFAHWLSATNWMVRRCGLRGSSGWEGIFSRGVIYRSYTVHMSGYRIHGSWEISSIFVDHQQIEKIFFNWINNQNITMYYDIMLYSRRNR